MIKQDVPIGLTPVELGLPEKFTSWRYGQEGAVLDATECERRFLCNSMPTGWGKSLWYIAVAKLLDLRVCVLTSTKALQDQLLKDFSSIGLVDIRGRANYECCLGGGYTCDDGRHARCPRKQSTRCPYRAAYETACHSNMVVTNYSYWIYQHLYGDGLGDFDLLVCDEAHSAPEEICSALEVSITTREAYGMLRGEFPKERDNITPWKVWATNMLIVASSGREQCQDVVNMSPYPERKLVKELSQWKGLETKLKTIASCRGEWAITDGKFGVRITPLWPSEYAEQVLFRGIERIFLVSATIRPKTMQLLGVEQDTRQFLEYPPIFDPAHSPVYLLRTNNIRVNRSTTSGQRKIWLNWIDRIIDDRLDRKGIIHSVSYAARNYILENSRFREVMITHERENAAAMVLSFRHSPPPLILVSPSVTTGWDFPYDECRYQIMSKTPWPNMGDKVLQMREKIDSDYAAYMMAQAMVQACGRGNRAPDDFCENFIVDWGFARFASRKCPPNIRDLFPTWFWQLFQWADTIPRPIPLPEETGSTDPADEEPVLYDVHGNPISAIDLEPF